MEKIPEKINPELSQNFLKEIKEQVPKVLDIDGLHVETAPNVFPPESQFSHSSIDLHRIFGNIEGCLVLDVGTGTGIQAMQTIKRGAREVVAIDINDEAVACAEKNVVANGMVDKVKVLKSDLFKNVPKEKFDLIIANLPITDFPAQGKAEAALYDPNFILHQRFLNEVQEYLSAEGRIVLTHANLQSEHDFESFEQLISDAGLSVDEYLEYEAIGYTWRMYRLVVANNLKH